MPEFRPKALVLGGTAETAPLAQKLAELGWQVLVSTFSDAPLDLGSSTYISRRIGPLDAPALLAFLQKDCYTLAIDALHPYASAGHATCAQVARTSPCRWLRLARPESELPAHAHICITHDIAVAQMLALAKPVLLTIGSRHLAPYVQAARNAGLPLLARVLDDPASLRVCTGLGLAPHEIHAQRGPFSQEQNLAHLDQIGAGCLITKDGGTTGGLPEKLEAAARRSCAVLVVARPSESSELETYPQIEHLLAVLQNDSKNT